jgi:hypothetical protein
VATTTAPEAAAPDEELAWAEEDAAPDRLDPADPGGLAEVPALLDAAAELADGEGLAAVPDVDDPHPATSTAVSAAPQTSRPTAPHRIVALIMITLLVQHEPGPAGSTTSVAPCGSGRPTVRPSKDPSIPTHL